MSASFSEAQASRKVDAPRAFDRPPATALRLLAKRSFPRAFAFIALQWASIAFCAYVAERSDSLVVLAASLVVIATRQHALLVMLHEAAHFSISANKALNDFVGATLCAFPFSVSLRRYRTNHLAHHRFVNTERDPDLHDNVAPTSLWGLAKTLACDLLFLSLPNYIRRSNKFGVLGIFWEQGSGWWTERATFLSFLLALSAVVGWLGLWKILILYWIVPLFSILQVILRVRGYSEHAGRIAETDELLRSRTVDAGPLERFLLAPGNVNRHLEHHLYPYVPFFNLEKLHGLLASAQNAESVAPARGYVRLLAGRQSVFGELYRTAPLKIDATNPTAQS